MRLAEHVAYPSRRWIVHRKCPCRRKPVLLPAPLIEMSTPGENRQSISRQLTHVIVMFDQNRCILAIDQ